MGVEKEANEMQAPPKTELEGQVRNVLEAMSRLTPEDQNKIAQANMNHVLALHAWKIGNIDDAEYLKHASEYADILESLGR